MHAMLESNDKDEREVLHQVLTWINTTSFISVADLRAPSIDPTKVVGRWFWESLGRTSIAFRAWEQDRRRDEDALPVLTRFLSEERFPNLRLETVTLDGFD